MSVVDPGVGGYPMTEPGASYGPTVYALESVPIASGQRAARLQLQPSSTPGKYTWSFQDRESAATASGQLDLTPHPDGNQVRLRLTTVLPPDDAGARLWQTAQDLFWDFRDDLTRVMSTAHLRHRDDTFPIPYDIVVTCTDPDRLNSVLESWVTEFNARPIAHLVRHGTDGYATDGQRYIVRPDLEGPQSDDLMAQMPVLRKVEEVSGTTIVGRARGYPLAVVPLNPFWLGIPPRGAGIEALEAYIHAGLYEPGTRRRRVVHTSYYGTGADAELGAAVLDDGHTLAPSHEEFALPPSMRERRAVYDLQFDLSLLDGDPLSPVVLACLTHTQPGEAGDAATAEQLVASAYEHFWAGRLEEATAFFAHAAVSPRLNRKVYAECIAGIGFVDFVEGRTVEARRQWTLAAMIDVDIVPTVQTMVATPINQRRAALHLPSIATVGHIGLGTTSGGVTFP